MGGRAEGQACADLGARTPIGASGHSYLMFWAPYDNPFWKNSDDGKEKERRRGEKYQKISARADGGPRSRFCSRDTPAQPPIDASGNFPAHISVKLPSTISPPTA